MSLMSSKNVCPLGWRVPTSPDWDTLLRFVGGPYWDTNPIITGLKLMEPGTIANSTGYWSKDNSANNASGFSGRPAGQATPPWSSFPWSFSGKGSFGNWWGMQGPLMLVQLSGADGAVSTTLGVQPYPLSPSDKAYSVRCIKGTAVVIP